MSLQSIEEIIDHVSSMRTEIESLLSEIKALKQQVEQGKRDAVPEGYMLIPASAIAWLMGEGYDFTPDRRGMYWWRSKFQELIAAAPKQEN